jgi:HEXXH motif-containing protein
VVPVENNHLAFQGFDVHRLAWTDLDRLARGGGGAGLVRRLRHAERSRRLLLLRALVEEVAKNPELSGPLPPPESAWELLVRVQEKSPAALERMLAHPYTGFWESYTMRLLRNRTTGVCPLWVHIGHINAIGAAAAIRAELDFHIEVPLWDGCAMLPTLGLARLPARSRWSVAQVCAGQGLVTVSSEDARVRVQRQPSPDVPDWWEVRRLAVRAGGRGLSVQLDDLDPYRGLFEPVPPQRLDAAEVDTWRSLLDEAWRLIVRYRPGLADAMAAGLDSLVPRPATPFRLPSASTGEAFGSAIIGLPTDAASLAATLVHEFQHILLGGIFHLTPLHAADHRERFYTGWRDDPRPIGGVLQGVYAFFGVSAFWRALARAGTGATRRRAAFEFAYWRGETWRTLCELRTDPSLTPAGHRFVDGVAEVLGPWQNEPVPADLSHDAAALAADHYAGWRMRFVRPDPATVATIADAWRAGRSRLGAIAAPNDRSPTPVPDGSWSRARADLIRLRLTQPRDAVEQMWPTIPDATASDYAYATGRFTEAENGYRRELAADPDRPASWVGLGLALAARGTGPAGRALLHYPELVRATHRTIRNAPTAPAPDELADWIGRSVR